MGKKRSYPAAFRQQMVALVRSAWVRQADHDEGRRDDGLTSRERE